MSTSVVGVHSTYARYKHCTNLVHEWCDSLTGLSSVTLRDWASSMELLAKRGEKMPVAVRGSLDTAITLRDEANAFYRAIQAAEEQQKRHWYVCRLLRQFRRLFSPRASAQPPTEATSAAAPSSSPVGFEALAIETADNESPSDDNQSPSEAEHAADVADVDAASTEEADPVFAFACLLADAVRTRQECARYGRSGRLRPTTGRRCSARRARRRSRW